VSDHHKRLGMAERRQQSLEIAGHGVQVVAAVGAVALPLSYIGWGFDLSCTCRLSKDGHLYALPNAPHVAFGRAGGPKIRSWRAALKGTKIRSRTASLNGATTAAICACKAATAGVSSDTCRSRVSAWVRAR
jgi:hypothetical protein